MRGKTLMGATVASAATIAIAVVMQWSGVGQALGSGEHIPTRLDAAGLEPTLHPKNKLDIDAGHVAQANGAIQSVKNYASTLVRDHHATDDKLTAYAQASGVPNHCELPANVQRDLEQAKLGLDKLRTKVGGGGGEGREN